MPISQLGIMSGSRRRMSQIPALNARVSMLPQIIANKQRKEDIEREEAYNKATLRMTARGQRVAQRAGQVASGLEAGKLGMNIMNRYGETTVGDAVSKGGSLFGWNPGNSFVGSNINLGAGVGGAAAGYGAGQMVGGDNKLKKSAVGAGVGALMGLLSGGGWGGAVSGGVGGGLGGLFG